MSLDTASRFAPMAPRTQPPRVYSTSESTSGISRHLQRRGSLWPALLALFFSGCLTVRAFSAGEDSLSAHELKQLSLEELLEVEISTASRKEEKLLEIPAAV